MTKETPQAITIADSSRDHAQRAINSLLNLKGFRVVDTESDRADYLPSLKIFPKISKRGTVPTMFINPFCGHLDYQDRYSSWSECILSGSSRLEHGGEKPLPVKTLYELLEALPEISSEVIAKHLGVSVRMARRYLLALQVALQYLMRSRPLWLRLAMGDDLAGLLIKPEPDAELTVCPVQLAKLREDLGAETFTDYGGPIWTPD